MKTKAALLLLPCLIYAGCNGQTDFSINDLQSQYLAENKDSLNKPRVNIHVNKHFDKHGNIIKYDSTYSYFYSSPGSNYFFNNNTDSLLNHFRKHFQKNYSDSLFPPLFNDSLFNKGFFDDDYLRRQMELNKKLFEEMYQQMNKFEEDYMKQKYPQESINERTI